MGALYSGVSITGYNANPPDDDGSQTEANRVKWETIKDKLNDPVKDAVEGVNDALQDSFGKIDGGVTSTAISYAVVESDQGKLVRATASGITITTPDATDVGAPFVFAISNDTSGNITLDGFGAQTVDGDASTTIPAGCGLRIRTNGSNWFTEGQNFPTTVIYPRGSFENLVIKVTGNTGLTVTADSITVWNGTDSKVLASVSHTINMATTGANALDTGSIAQATWYAIWEIAKADGTKAALASTSFTSPTMPTDYTYKKRIGAVRTAAGSAQLHGTWQFGNDVSYILGLAQTTVLPNIANGTAGTFDQVTPTLASASVSTRVPSTASKIKLSVQGNYNSGSNANVLVAPSSSYGGTNSQSPAPLYALGGNVSVVSGEMTLESTNIYWCSNAAGGGVSCRGWVDNL